MLLLARRATVLSSCVGSVHLGQIPSAHTSYADGFIPRCPKRRPWADFGSGRCEGRLGWLSTMPQVPGVPAFAGAALNGVIVGGSTVLCPRHEVASSEYFRGS
jgi:hypothetical protein